MLKLSENASVSLYMDEMCCFVHLLVISYHHLLSSSFLNLLVTGGQVHSYPTGATTCYRSHFCRTNIKQFTILYLGPKIWNSLPTSVSKNDFMIFCIFCPVTSTHLQARPLFLLHPSSFYSIFTFKSYQEETLLYNPLASWSLLSPLTIYYEIL